jgi:hypothetical protein
MVHLWIGGRVEAQSYRNSVSGILESAISTVLVKNKKRIPAAFHGNTLPVEVVGPSETGYTWGGVLAGRETKLLPGDCLYTPEVCFAKPRGVVVEILPRKRRQLGCEGRQCDCAPGCCMPVTA